MIGRTNAGGGGTGATLTVNAPAGVTVVATNATTNRTYTRTANSSGVATFKGLPTGTYSVHITDGTTTSDNFTANVVADYALTVKFFAAYINVTYPSGSTCTCTDGATTFTATSTSGSYQFVVPHTGTWTVSCTDGSQSTSASVSITADEQTKSVTLSYFAATIKITYPKGSTCTCRNGSLSYTAPNTSGSWSLKVTTPGTWIVTCSNGIHTDTKNVYATSSGSYNVSLGYDKVLLGSGNTIVGMPDNCYPSSYWDGDHIVCSNRYAPANQNTDSKCPTPFSTHGYSTIVVGVGIENGWVNVELANQDSNDTIVSKKVYSSETVSLDISSINLDRAIIRFLYLRTDRTALFNLYSVVIK